MKPKRRELILNEIKTNHGIKMWYVRTLINMVRTMKSEMDQIIARNYKPQAKIEKKTKLAMDSAASDFGDALNRFKKKWNKRLDQLADNWAEELIKRTVGHYENNLNNQLERYGLSMPFSITPYQKQQYAAVVYENVSLIRSISQRYITNVASIVFENISSGYQLGKLSDSLQKQFGIEKRRANNIARDQSDKAHAVTEQAKRLELGIEEAIWKHSGRGKVPRKSHVLANNKRFNVQKGCLIDGEYILPGMKINCKCGSQSVITF